MATGYINKARKTGGLFDLKRVTPDHVVEAYVGDDVTLPCQLSPEISAVAKEIRWFKGTDCIYLYKNGHVTAKEAYEGRVSVNTQELQRGDMSLTLRQRRLGDGGVYTCQVISGEHKLEGRVWLRPYFKLVIPEHVLKISGDVTLPCHFSPETSAVAMEIRWFKGTDCIYLYKDGHVTEGRGYEGRVSVINQEMQRGDVSLRLRKRREEDRGVYTCQVISGKLKEEGRVRLKTRLAVEREKKREITDEERKRMEESVQSLAHRRQWPGGVSVGIGLKMKREITAEERKRMEESVQCLALPAWRKATDELMEKNKQLEENKKDNFKLLEESKERLMEMEKTKQQLEERNKLIQERETELENMTKREKEREGLLENMTTEVEASKRQLEEREREHLNVPDPPPVRRRHTWPFLSPFNPPQMKRRNSKEFDPPSMEGESPVPSGFQTSDPDPSYRRRNSKEFDPPSMRGESPGPAPPMSPAVSELRLVLLGGSTAGKRAAGNTILGTEEFGRQASTHTSTETQHSESRQGEVAGRRVTVVETPDWFCSGLSEKDLRQDVGLCVRLSAPGPHAFLLVIPVEPSEGEERRMLDKMEDMFGEGCWGHTLILFTYAEGLRERNVEELLQTGSQELQQLVEKCGNRCHLLNVKDRPDDTKITQLLEKIEEMVSGNRDKFYSSETYQEAEKQLREIERIIQKEREVEERKLREERERREELDKNMREYLKKMDREIKQNEGEIRTLYERITELEINMKEERDEEKKREMKRELNREITQREEMERKLIRVREKRERERSELEERHREEMEEMRENYEREARAEAEKNLMKIILPELQRNITITKEKMEGQFNRQMEEKDREMERMKRLLNNRESESERERRAIRRLSTSLLDVMSSEEQGDFNRQMQEKDRDIEGLVETVHKLSRLVEEAEKQGSLQS